MSTSAGNPKALDNPLQPGPTEAPPAQPRRNFAGWRAVTLVSVYVLMAVQVTHWVVKGKTVAPLELNEVMYTFDLGIVTVGFMFMCAALLSALIFGPFFCP